MFVRISVLSLAVLAISGCATGGRDGRANDNPFNEAGSDKATSLPIERTANQPPLAEKKGLQSLDSVEGVVVLVPEPDRPAINAQGVGYQNDRSYLTDMIEEANRLGAMGDRAGKVQLLVQAGNSGSGQAFYEVARMHQNGQLPKDETAMVGYLVRAQNLDHAESTRVLGHLYLQGNGVEQDTAYGRMLLEVAAGKSSRAAKEYGLLLTNQRQPFLNDLELGIIYLQTAVQAGDADSSRWLNTALQRAGRGVPEPVIQQATESNMATQSAASVSHPTASKATLKERALQGDMNSVFQYGQQLLIGRVPSADPTYSAYCWLSVAEKMGHPDAAREIRFISGARTISDKKSPGKLDKCISDLHYTVTGHD